MNSKNILLNRFRDNKSNLIKASDLRMLVEAIYNELLLVENVIDQDTEFDVEKVASLNITSRLREDVDKLIDAIDDKSYFNNYYKKDEIDSKFYDKHSSEKIFFKRDLVYDKAESDNRYYTKEEIDKLLSQLK